MKHLQNKKGEVGLDLASWSMQELKEAVKEFIKENSSLEGTENNPQAPSPKDEDLNNEPPNDEIYEVNNIILGATNNEKIVDFDRAINDLLSDDSNRQSSREVMTNIINSWKKEYIKLCNI